VITVPVELGPRSYPVMVGPGARHALADVLPEGARRAAIVTQDAVPVVVEPGLAHQRFLIGPDEGAKRLTTVEDLCRGFARFGLTRADVVVAVGGGVVTDAAGFAAAVYHRGVAVVHVATTLLAQVDAAIGGKTGVNLPEGKNVVGAFWQPAAVLCDTETLETLPAEEYRSGCGEMAKYHFLNVDGFGGEGFGGEGFGGEGLGGEGLGGEDLGGEDLAHLELDERVAHCVAIKAAVVASDERESGRRAVLNYGHTLAHALETAGGYGLRHGEAVAVGLVFAARLAHRLGRIDEARVHDHLEVVRGYDLPEAVPPGVDPNELVVLMGRDKKATSGMTFVLDGPHGVEPVPGVAPADVEATLKEMC
jgi:5-deoxy-5-amino-3-dehydroquinate synthase